MLINYTKNDLSYFTGKVPPDRPFNLIDIGAMSGLSSEWNSIANDITVTAFEPDPREFIKLKSSSRRKYFNYALNDVSSDIKYHIARSTGKSSLFLPDTQELSKYNDPGRFDIVGEEIIPSSRVKTLDMLIEEGLVNDPDFLKIDTQGSELKIMKGGSHSFMKRMFGAKVEVEFIRMYKGQPLFRDIDAFMAEQGFRLIDLKRNYWKKKYFKDYKGKGPLAFGDALYLREPGDFVRSLKGSSEPGYERAKALKAAIICLVYKLYDLAAELLEEAFTNAILRDDEYNGLLQALKKSANKGFLSRVFLERRVYFYLWLLLENIKPRSLFNWADSDKTLGNAYVREIRDKESTVSQ